MKTKHRPISYISASEVISNADKSLPLVVVFEQKRLNNDYLKAINVEVWVQNEEEEFERLGTGYIQNLVGIKVLQEVPDISYHDYIDSPEWAQRKTDYFQNHTRVCHVCGADKDVQVHHLSYERLGYERDDDLIPLCADCHEKIHNYFDQYKYRVGNVGSLWNCMYGGISGANVNGELINQYITTNKRGLEWIFRGLPPIQNCHKMRFISVFRDTVKNLLGEQNCLPFNMLAKLIKN